MIRAEKKAFNYLTKARKTLSLAESCTGGLMAHRLTNLAGSSAFLMLGVVAYDNAAKTKILGVPSGLIKKHGAVSRQVALAMAQGVRKILKTDYGLSITGIAGPSGGTKEKPVGLVFMALSTAHRTVVKKFHFKGSRLQIKQQAAQSALKMLAK